jgi:branched-chain amino acid transport system ATP-binding protein
MLLEVRDVEVFIQSSRILRGVSLEVDRGEVVCLVGRNGAGKTTTLRTVMGYLRPAKGIIRFKGIDLTKKTTDEIGRMGIGYAPEDSAIFPDLTTHENIEISTWTRNTGRSGKERIELAYEVFPALRNYMNRKGTQMSGGERKMLSIARALALDAELFLLDEPFEGLAPAFVIQLAGSIQKIATLGTSILIVESNVYHVPDFAQRLYVLERGELIFSGLPRDVATRDDVMRIIAGAA